VRSKASHSASSRSPRPRRGARGSALPSARAARARARSCRAGAARSRRASLPRRTATIASCSVRSSRACAWTLPVATQARRAARRARRAGCSGGGRGASRGAAARSGSAPGPKRAAAGAPPAAAPGVIARLDRARPPRRPARSPTGTPAPRAALHVLERHPRLPRRARPVPGPPASVRRPGSAQPSARPAPLCQWAAVISGRGWCSPRASRREREVVAVFERELRPRYRPHPQRPQRPRRLHRAVKPSWSVSASALCPARQRAPPARPGCEAPSRNE
jgi:hypothetical protein